MRPHERKNLVRVGIFITALFALIVIGTVLLSSENSILASKMYLYSAMENADNLKTGAAVRYKGIKIGTVRGIQVKNMNEIIITMKVLKEYDQWIKKDSVVALETQGILGDRLVEIQGGSEAAGSINDGDFLPSQKAKKITDFIVKGEDILLTSHKALAQLNILLTALNEEGQIQKLVKGLNSSNEDLGKLIKTIDHLVAAIPKQNLKVLTDNLANISTRIKEGPGTLNSLIYDNSIHQDLQILLGGAQRNKIIKYFVRESVKNAPKE